MYVLITVKFSVQSLKCLGCYEKAFVVKPIELVLTWLYNSSMLKIIQVQHLDPRIRFY